MSSISSSRSSRIWHSFLGVIAGWIFCLVYFALRSAWVTVRLSGLGWSEFGYYFLFWGVAFFVSGVVTLIGWTLLGLPAAYLMSDRMVKRLSIMLLLHTGMTSGAAIAIKTFREDNFVLSWAVLTGLLWGTTFWMLERQARLTRR